MIWRPYILKSISVDEVQDCKCASCSQRGSGVKKTGTRSGIQLKRFRKVENSVEKFHRQVKFPMDKTVIGGKKYELKGLHTIQEAQCQVITQQQ